MKRPLVYLWFSFLYSLLIINVHTFVLTFDISYYDTICLISFYEYNSTLLFSPSFFKNILIFKRLTEISMCIV